MAKAGREVVPATVTDVARIDTWDEEDDPTVRLIEAIGAACAAVPRLNAWFDGSTDTLLTHEKVDLGIAVAFDETLAAEQRALAVSPVPVEAFLAVEEDELVGRLVFPVHQDVGQDEQARDAAGAVVRADEMKVLAARQADREPIVPVVPDTMMENWPRTLLTTFRLSADGAGTSLTLEWVPHEATEAEAESFAAAIDQLGQGWGKGMDVLAEVLAEL